MFELFQRARWDQAYDFLASGEPSMMVRILVINTIFLIIYIIRRTRSPGPIKDHTVLQIQGLLVLANALVIFQRDILQFLDRFI